MSPRRAVGPVALFFAASLALACGLLFARGVRATFSDTERLGRLRSPQEGDRLRVSGVLHEGASPEDEDEEGNRFDPPRIRHREAPVCSVLLERWETCGKNHCWVTRASMTLADGTLETVGGERYDLSAGFQIHPIDPDDAQRGHVVLPEREDELRARAARAGVLGFQRSTTPGDTRIVERCLREGDDVFAIACRRDGAEGEDLPTLGRCADDEPWILAIGDGTPQAALDEAADLVLYWYAAAMVPFIGALLLLWPRRHKLAELLATRAGRPPRAAGWVFFALFVPVVAAFLTFMWRHGTPVTSTWSSGRGAYALASLVGAVVLIVAVNAARRRSILRDAVRPIEATPRSPLASATGSTVELSVRACAEPTHRSYVHDEAVAYSSLSVREIYRVGKSTGTRDLVVGRSPSKELRVEDESGDGVLDMDAALLDVEVHELKSKLPDPFLEQRTGTLERHESHLEYVVTEEIIRPGEQLYVLGEVVRVALQAGDGGYRGVRGAPTLSGPDAPLLVYSGTERGLLEELRAEDRALGVVIALATGGCAVLCAVVVGLAAL